MAKRLECHQRHQGHPFHTGGLLGYPFDTKGTGEKQVKLFFPHIIVDFDLPMAMKQGLVKLLLLDRRQELTDLENLDYNAERDEQGKVVGLSEGQRMMLRAGLTKLNKLEEEFLKMMRLRTRRCSSSARTPRYLLS